MIPLPIPSKSICIVDLSAYGKLFIRPVYCAGMVMLEAATYVEDVGKCRSDVEFASLLLARYNR